MKKRIDPSDLALELFNAKENRSWQYFNIPWAWESSGLNAQTESTEDGIEASVLFPTSEYPGEAGSALHGRMITRAIYRVPVDMAAKIGGGYRVRYAFDWDFDHSWKVHSSRSVKIKYRIGFQTSWRLYAIDPSGDERMIELQQKGQDIFMHKGRLRLPNEESNTDQLASKTAPPASDVFEAKTWPMDRAAEKVSLQINFWLNIGMRIRGQVTNLHGNLAQQRAVIAHAALKEIELESLDPDAYEDHER